MDGFVWYKNSAGVMIPTSFAVPYLLTGIEPDENEDLSTYLERRYTESSFLEDLHATNYSIGVYTDTFGLAYLDDDQEQTEIYNNVMNIHPVSEAIRVSPKDTILLLTRCSLYRDMPWVFKPRFWFYGHVHKSYDPLGKRIYAYKNTMIINVCGSYKAKY